MSDQTDKTFTYQLPKDGQPEKYERIAKHAKKLAEIIEFDCPESRERSLAMTKLEEVVMWSNASISKNE